MNRLELFWLTEFGGFAGPPYWPYLYWGAGLSAAVRHALLLAEDHSFHSYP